MLGIHRAAISRRVWYWNHGSVTFYPYGIHVDRRQPTGWRQYRLAFFSRKSGIPGTHLIDFSIRDTEKARTKPLRPCWRFWIGVKVGRTWSKRHYGPRPTPAVYGPGADCDPED